MKKELQIVDLFSAVAFLGHCILPVVLYNEEKKKERQHGKKSHCHLVGHLGGS